jgi:hypothetical protein
MQAFLKYLRTPSITKPEVLPPQRYRWRAAPLSDRKTQGGLARLAGNMQTMDDTISGLFGRRAETFPFGDRAELRCCLFV